VLANALLGAAVILLALLMVVLQVCGFLSPWRDQILRHHGWTIGLYVAALFFSLAGGLYWLNRAIFLKDTGRKLSHLEKQVRTRSAIVMELTAQLEDDDVQGIRPN
jgi:hypothetical protein